MLTRGKRFRLSRATIAVFLDDQGHQVATTIPADSIIEIVKQLAKTDKIVAIEWDGKPYEVFAQDLQARGVEVNGQGGDRLPF